jgi:UDP-N-acetylglucosamine:LPS N-acetylglucosamine transferase
VQLMRLRPALEGCDVTYATVRESYRFEIGSSPFYVVPDCNRSQRFHMLRCCAGVFSLLLQVCPDVVISTGAAPGYFAIRFGRWLGAKTIWVDSVANAEELSMSGRIVQRYADLWLTQWPHLASGNGPHFRGSVL